jgi:hypothetical protein
MKDAISIKENSRAAFFAPFNDSVVDQIQAWLERLPQCEVNLTHRFSPGLYSREVTMPAYSMCVSLTHKTEHQWIVSKGEAIVWSKNMGAVKLKAPMAGITKPGERRVFFVQGEDFVITNFHATDETDPEKFIEVATERRDVSHIKEFDPFIRMLFENPVKLLN